MNLFPESVSVSCNWRILTNKGPLGDTEEFEGKGDAVNWKKMAQESILSSVLYNCHG